MNSILRECIQACWPPVTERYPAPKERLGCRGDIASALMEDINVEPVPTFYGSFHSETSHSKQSLELCHLE
jgi:hypothetical protein